MPKKVYAIVCETGEAGAIFNTEQDAIDASTIESPCKKTHEVQPFYLFENVAEYEEFTKDFIAKSEELDAYLLDMLKGLLPPV